MAIDNTFVFTTENLLDNLDKLGPWSQYGLASSALAHYFPDLYDEDEGICPCVPEEAKLLVSMGHEYWSDLVIQYHKEVGYTPKDGVFCTDYVNAY